MQAPCRVDAESSSRLERSGPIRHMLLVVKLGSAERVRRTRNKLRAAGLRPSQAWVPDTRAPGFAEKYRRNCLVVNVASATDPDPALWDAWIDEKQS